MSKIDFTEANQNLIWVLSIGAALGIANYSLGAWPTLGQSIIQQTIISFVIGYSILVVVYNIASWLPAITSNWKKKSLLVLIFGLVGLIGSEVEAIVNCMVFQQATYQPFSNSSYLFNLILSIILGLSLYIWSIPKEPPPTVISSPIEIPPAEEPLTAIPIHQGEAIFLHPLDTIIYFEAYDNYSFLYDLAGQKQLCNYSLLYLEKKLPAPFVRVHRKYLINKDQIYQVQPHLKGRYVLTFKDKKRSTINSSASYSDIIKGLIKL